MKIVVLQRGLDCRTSRVGLFATRCLWKQGVFKTCNSYCNNNNNNLFTPYIQRKQLALTHQNCLSPVVNYTLMMGSAKSQAIGVSSTHIYFFLTWFLFVWQYGQYGPLNTRLRFMNTCILGKLFRQVISFYHMLLFTIYVKL